MNEQTTVQDASVADKAKITVTILLVIGGIAAYYLLSAQPAWERWVAFVGGIVLGIAVFASSKQGREFWQFMLDSRIELRKVSMAEPSGDRHDDARRVWLRDRGGLVFLGA